MKGGMEGGGHVPPAAASAAVTPSVATPCPAPLPHSVRPEPPIRCAISLHTGKLAADIALDPPCATPATRLRLTSPASHSTGVSLLRLFWAYAPT